METTGFFESAPGKKSSKRLIYVIGMLFLFGLIFFIVYLKAFQKLEVTWMEICFVFGTIAGILEGTKLAQNKQENEAIKSTTETKV